MGGLKSLIEKGRIWIKLSNKERSLFLQALVLLPLVALLLRLCGLQRTQAALMLWTESTSSEPSKVQVPLIKATAQMVQSAARYSKLWTNCLKKSLVLWYLLRCQGIAAQLQIGVRLEQGQFLAHAWVEYQGFVVGDYQDVKQHYTPLDRLNTELNSYISLL
ncbi:lasso peptide biosynthesis B2 protein [Nostoc sp.]|uniref:lasso peptide biosynthesis B2 protein n=1 Tax=Nostoc sp. TaxID=1180 RepID=UPI002FFB496B